MFKVNFYIKRTASRTPGAFKEYWLHTHAQLSKDLLQKLGVRQYLKCEVLPENPLTLASQEAYQTGPLGYDFIDHWVFNNIDTLTQAAKDEVLIEELESVWMQENDWVDLQQSHTSMTVDLAQFFPRDGNEVRATPESDYLKIYYPAHHYPHLTRTQAQLHWNACHGAESRQHIRYSRQKKYIQCHTIDSTFVDWLREHRGYGHLPCFIGHAEGWIDPGFEPEAAGAEDAAEIVRMTMDDIDLFSDKTQGSVFMAQEHYIVDQQVITRTNPSDPDSSMPAFFSAAD